jgi:CxxC motif-containing protein (DUF1111 family)
MRRVLAIAALGLACAADGTAPLPGEELAGGETTVFDATRFAFSYHARNLDDAGAGQFFVGNSFFNDNWVTAPSSTAARDGLGPLFNARSCSGCHTHDGRGRPPELGEAMLSMLIRLSVPGVDDVGGPRPEPSYGGQLQPQAIGGVPAEGRATVAYVEQPGTYADGESYSLRVPTYAVLDLAGAELAKGVMFSPRVAPQMIGLGLLEAIAETDLLARVDEHDADGDGISGRANHPWDPIAGAAGLGRFGWKANQVGLRQQVTGAFLGDMGITSSVHPVQDCAGPESECQAAATGGDPEASESIIDRVVFYSAVLAVPGRRDVDDDEVLAGRSQFAGFGCADCHVPSWRTGKSAIDPALSNQRVWPYTDLLLHDLGDALSDARPDFDADGREWRTPPLWGLGLVSTVNHHTTLLHDGRARDFAEAILWHGGEAEAAREAFRTASADDRDAVIAFLGSL